MQLVWFRQDLRVHDHAALWHATQNDQCVALVILSPTQWQKHHDCVDKIALYLKQIEALKTELNHLNIPLIIQTIDLWENVAEQIEKLCLKYEIANVHANIELGQNELKRDSEVQNQLNTSGKDLILYHDRTLFPVQSIRNKSNLPYQVFGAFKKACYEKLSFSLPKCYAKPEIQQPVELESTDVLPPKIEDIYPNISHKNLAEQWSKTEEKVFELLDEFIEDKVRHYQLERDFPSLAASSQLSTYLNLGVISIRQCMQALFRAQHGDFFIENTGQQTWLDELLWREFYQHILFDFPRVSKNLPFKINTLKLKWQNNEAHFQAWKYGQTGIPIVDAGMRQMLATGWMHNRVRMIVAMFLSKNLLIDWRKGEQWFMQNLMDGDLAANNGGWQWCASTGTDAVPYFRIFNPVSQSERFDKNGDYIRQWLPELSALDAKTIHDPYAKNPNIVLDYPRPIVDLKATRLAAIEAFKSI